LKPLMEGARWRQLRCGYARWRTGLSRRERVLLLAMALLMAAAAALEGAWLPLNAALAQRRAQMAQLENDAWRMQAMHDELQQLQRRAPLPAAAGSLLAQQLHLAAREQGVSLQGWMLTPEPRALAVQGVVDFDQWLGLLARLQNQYAISARQMRLQADAVAGRVRVQARLARGKEGV